MNSKKLLPLLVIASMILSLLPTFMFANAVLSPPFLDPGNTGVKGNTIKVTGTNLEIPAGTPVQLYWDDSTIAWNGVKGLLNSTTAKANGNYEVWFKVPEATSGSHYIWIKTTTGGIADVTSALFTVNPTVKLAPTSGLSGDNIVLTMYGYPKSAAIKIDFGAAVAYASATANSIGTATATIKVPASLAYAPYNVVAYNGTITSTAIFTVGPVITISPTTATVGSVITITGRGFANATQIVQGDVMIDGQNACWITTTVPITVDATGRIRLSVVLSQVTAKDDYTLIIDSAAGFAQADLTVTALASVKVTPSYGPQASSITVSGTNFPKVANVNVDVMLGAIDLGTAKTLADGTFSKAFKVPAIADGIYVLNADSGDYMISKTTNFKVGTMNIILSDDSGPTGMTVGITGNGFTPDGGWNATIGSKTLIDNAIVSPIGLINSEFLVPQLAVGTYTITVWDVDAKIVLTTDFQVTATTTVTTSVSSAPNGFNVTLKGLGFADTDGPVVFVLYNQTSAGAMDFWWTLNVVDLPVGTGPCATNSSGKFYGYWKVPDADILSKGDYKINVTDIEDYAVTVPFTVGDTHIVCTPRKGTFKVGETISFNVEHSFGNTLESFINVYNPNSTLVWEGDILTFVKTGLWYTAPYSGQTSQGNPMLLLDDAPLGTWSFKWFNDANGKVIKSGTFTVVASTESVLTEQVTGLTTAVNDLKTQVTGISTSLTGVQSTITAVQTSADAAKASADAATTAVNAVNTKADTAIAAANSAAAAAKAASDSAAGLTTLVYVAIGAAFIAALAAIVVLMQVSKISGKMA